MTLPLARRSAVQVPRRDIVLGAGDELRLRVRLAESDHHRAPIIRPDLFFARIRMQVWQEATPLNGRADYAQGWRGPLMTSASAMAKPANPHWIEVAVSHEETAGWRAGGRLGWSLQCAVQGDDTALCWGALHMRPGVGMPPLRVLTGDDENVLTSEREPVVI